MSLVQPISLSTAAEIENKIQHATYEFSTIDIMGSMVNNAKFKQGYDDLVQGKTTEKSYVWEALSAVSQDLGQTLYQNVKNYIDNVGNVDTCKVRALKAMMKVIGSDYNVLDKIGYYPIEIQNLIDILSISKKYLLNNQYIKKDFLDACVNDGILDMHTPQQMLSDSVVLSDLSNESFLSIDAVSSSVDYYQMSSDTAFYSYLSNVYYNFICDMLTMHGTGSLSNVELYTTGFLSGIYGQNAHYEDRYLMQKKDLNVDINFNVEQVVNDIDVGIDSLDNYTGDKLSLLLEEIDYRKSPATDLSSIDLATRNLFYRKQKVLEYAEFVDNMVFLPTNFLNYTVYPYNKDYLTMLSNAHHNTCISSDGSRYSIVEEYVEYAAMSLVEITKYISKIRDTIRLQTRKVFMKGTNNLLRYAANEFIIDYVNALKSSVPFEQLSTFLQKLSAHSIDDVAVQEYWDLTEYMNIGTSTTKYAVNANLANDRFFDETFKRVNGKLVPSENNIFTNEQLNYFYLNDLDLANTLVPALSSSVLVSNLSSNFYEFLSALFDVAANTAYYNDDWKFGIKLTNDVITEEIDEDLSTIKSIEEFISSYASSAEYEFSDSISVAQQIEEYENAVYKTVLDSERDGISSIYDEYYPVVDELSTSMAALTSDFNTLITKTYVNYFGKSNSIYCYDTNGNYLFDYYIGEGMYLNDDSYEMSSASARDWINDEHCYTFSISAAIEQLSNIYDNCLEAITTIIQNDLQQLDFIDPKAADLGNEMDSMQDFVNSKINQRTQYLQNTLQNLKDQAAQAKQDHTAIQSTFSSILASMPTLPHQNFYMVGRDLSNSDDEGTYYKLVDSTVNSKHLRESFYDAVSQARYAESSKYPLFAKVDCDFYLDELIKIDETQSLETQIEECMKVFDTLGLMSFGAGSSTIHTIGSQKVTLQSLQSSILKIKNNTLPSIVDQLKSVFNIEIDTTTAFGTKSCIERIEYIIAYLNSNVSDQNFNGDTVMKKYYDILSQINDISCQQYIPAKSQYEALWTEFDTFFADYAKGSDYMLFIPYNIDEIDKYRQKKDAVALDQINAQMDELDARYESMKKQFIDMCADNIIKLYSYDRRLYRYIYTGMALEYCLGDFTDKLITDIEVKDMIANEKAVEVVDQIQKYVTEVQRLYRKYFSYVIQYQDAMDYAIKFNALIVSFMSIITDIINKLEYNDDFEYAYSKLLFQNYSGIPEIATDPYYNLKNQTHPSYQIHPFMWNFIEHHLDDSALEQISKNIIELSYDGLEASKIMSSIDSLLGKFGNVIDVWKSNIQDYTGYITKYEQSNHVCEYTGKWSEVVGYEGAFYPPALSSYLELESPSLPAMMQYYEHLNLSKDQWIENKLSIALQSPWVIGKISEITKMHSPAEVHDIYKYYTDSYGNMYILYKQYNEENPSEQTKLATPGELWIRLVDTPIAFPLKMIVDMDNSSDTLPDSSSSNAMDSICDICMFESGAKFVMTGYKAVGNYTYTFSKALYVEYDVKHGCGAGRLKLVPTSMYEDSNDETLPFPNIDYNKPPSQMYLGCLTINTITIDAVYVDCDSSGHMMSDPNTYIYEVKADSVIQSTIPAQKLLGLSCSSDFLVISNHDENLNDQPDTKKSYVDFLFVDNTSNDDVFVSTHKDLSVGNISAAAGYVYNDPIHDIMNSLDLIDGNLTLKSVCVSEQNRKIQQHVHQLQTNTDLGYIPSYTYNTYENVLDIKEDLLSSHQIVELLGKSKPLDNLIDIVNPEPDPYITKRSLFEKYMYGRIYEDDGILHVPGDDTSVSSFDDYNYYQGDLGLENSIDIYSCWSMYPNMPNQYTGDYVFNYVNGHYQWNIRLGRRYTYERLRQLRLFIYSTTSIGKNPYVVAEMSDVMDQSEDLAENDFLSTNYNAQQYDTTTYSFSDGAFVMAIAGTQNGIDQVDSYFSNALPNIIGFTFKYSTLGGGMYLKLDFKMKDINAGGYIEAGAVKVALVDMLDLSFYNWYHFLDPGVTFGDYQRVLNKLSGDPLTKAQLMAIDFSNYSYLSDIQVNGMRIFETNSRLQFKINEEDNFYISSYNYYVPSLNIKYPLTFAQAFDKMYNVPKELIGRSVNIYDPDEVFQLEVTDADVLSSLQNLEMLYSDIVDDYRVYEEYFDVGTDGVQNNSRYSPDDSYFYQFVHFVNLSTGYGTTPLSIEQSACVDIRIDGTDIFSLKLNHLSVDPRKGEDIATDLVFSRDFSFKNLDISQKKRIIEHVKKFLRLHIGYSKTRAGIELYVNYQNYINSPYVKIVDGLPYMDLIPNTYLRLMPDESGLIDLIVQFRQYVGGVLMGVHNVLIATCKMYNVSDDKPKFVIERCM